MPDNLGDAVRKFSSIGVGLGAIKHAALEAGAKEFLKRAQAALGTYEYGWPPLAESTVAKKATGDSPGLETGEMHDSGSYEVHAWSFTVGFTDPKIAWFEHGTSRQPPRPVIGGTISHHGASIALLIGVRFGEILGATLFTGSISSAISRIMRR
jgi:hypothetical protein